MTVYCKFKFEKYLLRKNLLIFLQAIYIKVKT